MSRTPLADKLKYAYSVVAEAARRRVPTDQVLEERQANSAQRLSRRDFLKFAGVEHENEGNCFFAGEHTSIDFQGYLNGAVHSGQQAANDLLASL